MSNLKIGLSVVILLAIFVIIKNVKDKKLQLSFSIFSIITGIFMVIALVVPSLIENISNLLGFEVASNMLFLVAIFMIFYLIFRLMIIVSAEYKKNVVLIQENKKLKKRIQEMESKINKI